MSKTSFEIARDLIQIALLIATLCSAIKIGNTQNEINQRMLDANYMPSIFVVLDEYGNLEITNKGKSNLSFWGISWNGQVTKFEEPTIIPPESIAYVPSRKILHEAIEHILRGVATAPVEFYLKTEKPEKFIGKVILSITNDQQERSTSVRLVALSHFDWHLE